MTSDIPQYFDPQISCDVTHGNLKLLYLFKGASYELCYFLNSKIVFSISRD